MASGHLLMGSSCKEGVYLTFVVSYQLIDCLARRSSATAFDKDPTK